MANFPNSVTSFSAKQDGIGQIIAASHINTIQDEVAAIEDGYLNGTARLNSSNSTVATLSVTGGSTLATLSVTGGSTLTGDVVMSGTLTVGGGTVGGRAPSARVSNSADTEIPSGALQGLSWDTEAFDSASMHSGVNSSRIFLTSSGVWLVGATVQWNTNGTDRRTVLYLNDSTPLAGQASTSAGFKVQSLSVLHTATSTADYVTVQVISAGSTAKVTAVDATYGGSKFWAVKVSA